MYNTEQGQEARVHHRGSCKHDWCPSQLSWSVASSAVSLLSASRCTVTFALRYRKGEPFWNFSQDPQNFLSKLVTRTSVPIHYIPDLIQIRTRRRSFAMHHDTVISKFLQKKPLKDSYIQWYWCFTTVERYDCDHNFNSEAPSYFSKHTVNHDIIITIHNVSSHPYWSVSGHSLCCVIGPLNRWHVI